jgi:hypothetical protein
MKAMGLSLAAGAVTSTVTPAGGAADLFWMVLDAGLHLQPQPLGGLAFVLAVAIVALAAWGFLRFLFGFLLALDE